MNFKKQYSGPRKMKDTSGGGSKSKAKPTPVAMVAPELKHYDPDTGITKTCAVMGCDDSKNLTDEEYFRFPEDPHQRQIWTDLTGRINWTPTDFSYVCIQHFSVDSFECNADNDVVLVNGAVPSVRLPRHVLEVEYIDEETLDNDFDYGTQQDSNVQNDTHPNRSQFNSTDSNHQKTDKPIGNVELLKLFTEVQKMQRKAVSLRDKLKINTKIYNRQNRFLNRLKRIITMKKDILHQKRKKKQRILLSLQDKIREDNNGLVMAMPVKYTDDLRNFALSVYKYSPQAYIYCRNTLRTLLPSTDVLESWISSGYAPRSVLTTNSTVKVIAEQSEHELTCKVTLQ